MTVNLFLSSTFFLIRFEIVLTISYTSRRVLPDTRNPEGQAQRIFYTIKRYPGRSLHGIIAGLQSHSNMTHYIVPLVALYYASSATSCSFAFHESSIYPAISLATRSNPSPGPVSRKSRIFFGPEKPFVKLRLAYSVKLLFSYVAKGIKMKITAKFRASRRLRFADTKRMMSPEMSPKSFGTFKKQAPGLLGLLGELLGITTYSSV